MSLDQNLFTLVLTPNPEDASVVDLVDPAGTIYYRKQRTPNSPVYSVEVYGTCSGRVDWPNAEQGQIL